METMTAPRPVFPGQFLVIQRRCTQRQFLLRPDEHTNNAFVYLLAEAAQRFNIQIILPQMMSNHHHTVAYDPDGRHVEFREHFHKLLAKSQNALRGRWENLWSSEEPCIVEVIALSDLLDQLVYVATNPVEDGLVDKVHHWPGPNFVQALLSGKPMKARRPLHFFREHGSMPAEIELTLGFPAGVVNFITNAPKDGPAIVDALIAHPAVRRIQERYQALAETVSFVDGLSMEFADWRFNLRMSNTEPLLRLNVESRGNADLMRRRTDEILAMMV